ncbi:hypothetical protein GIB67_005934 [Kingdonia uniflora]|uniref:Bulb-type lectin domain-containing protein n=1 Tax=Kingdonia uniflora TaxID=39325 RepID=A0A7J7MBX3_9MAGN|nr:hypothetical protein GIB67_005934 [Kingdonia uniflora]
MSQGDPSYGQYQSPFTLSQPQPQAFSPYYQLYPLTQSQGFQSPNYFQNYLFHGEFTQYSQNDANASIPVEAVAPQKEKGKGRKKRAPAKQRPSMQVSENAEFLDETDDAGMHWTDADFTCLARALVTTSVNINGRTKGFTFYQNVNIAFNRDPEGPTRRSCGLTKSQWYALNAQCVAYKGIVAQERFRNSSGKTEENRENDAHNIYKGLNGGNDFKHREAYKILAREPRWANLRDDGLNHAMIYTVNLPAANSKLFLHLLDPLCVPHRLCKDESSHTMGQVAQLLSAIGGSHGWRVPQAGDGEPLTLPCPLHVLPQDVLCLRHCRIEPMFSCDRLNSAMINMASAYNKQIGRLVICFPPVPPLPCSEARIGQQGTWNSATNGKGTNCKATLQTNGNLVILSGTLVVWTSNTATGSNNYRLIMQSDGNAVIYGAAMWATNTVQPSKRRLF